MHNGLSLLEDTVVAQFPDHPWNKEGDGGEALTHCLGRACLGLQPPSRECFLLVGCRNWHMEPGEDLMPGLAREWTFQEEVSHGLRNLIAQGAARMVLQASLG